MTSASWQLQQALFTCLTAHAPLVSAVTGIFDAVPDGQPLPYVVLGEDIVTDWSAKGFAATEHRLTLHVWATARGRRLAKDILDLIDTAIRTRLPAPEQARLISLRLIQQTVLSSLEDDLHHGIIEYRGRLCPLV